MVARLAISPVVPDIIDAFEVSNSMMGLALGGMWLAYSMAQFPSGLLSDRFGERKIILIAIAGTAVASFLLAVSPLFPLFTLGIVFLGGIAGLHFTPATALISRVYEDVGGPVGIHNAGAPLGGLLAPVAATWVSVRYGWRPAVGLSIVVALPLVVLIARNVRPIEPTNPNFSIRRQLQLGSVVEMLARPEIAFTIGIATLATFVWQGTASFLPTYLISHLGWSSGLAAVAFSVYFVVQGFSGVGIGAFSDRFGRDTAIGICMLSGVIGFALIVINPGRSGVGAGIVFAGIGMSYHPAVLSRFLDEFSEAETGTGFGLVRTIYGIMAASGSVVAGVIADLSSWAASFGFMVVLLSIVLMSLVVNQLFGRRF